MRLFSHRDDANRTCDGTTLPDPWLNSTTLSHGTDTLTSSTPIRFRSRFLTSSQRSAPTLHGQDEPVTSSIPKIRRHFRRVERPSSREVLGPGWLANSTPWAAPKFLGPTAETCGPPSDEVRGVNDSDSTSVLITVTINGHRGGGRGGRN